MRSGPMCAKLGKILNDTLVISYIVMKWFAGCPVQSQRLIWSVGAPPIGAEIPEFRAIRFQNINQIQILIISRFEKS